MTLDDKGFDVSNSNLKIHVIITDMHAISVSINFGYIIYDANYYTVGIIPNSVFNPNKIASNILYGIS